MTNDPPFEAIFESSYHAIAFLNTEGIIEKSNALFNSTFSAVSHTNKRTVIYDCIKTNESGGAQQLFQKKIKLALEQTAVKFELLIEDSTGSICVLECTLRTYQRNEASGSYGLIFKAADQSDSVRTKRNLIEVKERFDLAMLGSGDGLWDWKVQEDLIFFSPGFRELMGLPQEEYIGGRDAFMQVIHPDDVALTRKALQDHFTNNIPFNHEFRLKNTADEYRWFLVKGQAILGNDGSPVRMAGSLTDIHEKKNLQQLYFNFSRLQTAVLDSLPDIVLLVTSDWFIKKIFNESGQFETLGTPFIEGQNLLDFLPEDVSTLFKKTHQSTADENKLAPFSFEIKKGHISFDFEVYLEKLNENEYVCIFRDITSLKKTQREIIQNELKYTNLLENMDIGIMEVDLNEKIRYASKHFLKMTGYTMQEIVEKNSAELLLGKVNKKERGILLGKRSKGISDNYRRTIRTKNGEFKELLISGAPVYDTAGRITGSVGLHIDITKETQKANTLQKVKELGKIGSFNIDLIHNKIYWDKVIREIFEVDDDFVPEINNVIEFYKQGSNRSRIEQALSEALKNGRSSDGIYEITTAKKNSKWIRVVAYVETADEKPVHIVGHTLDITAEKIQSIHFEKLKNHYESISSATNEVFFDWNIAEDEIVFNEGFYRLTGYARNKKEVATMAFLMCHVHPCDSEKFEKELSINLATKNLWEATFRFRTATECYIHLQMRGITRFDTMGTPIGLIGVMSDVTNLIQLQDQLHNQEVAHQKRLSETAMAAEQNERQFIGQELHDNIAQLLAVAQLQLNYYHDNPNRNEKILKEGIGILTSTIHEIRKLSHRLTGNSLKQEGIEQALEELITSLNGISSITFSFDSKIIQPSKIDGQRSLVVYRICQELLNNVIKYSNATHCTVCVEYKENNIIQLHVRDNGKGFDKGKVKKGIGLNYTIDRVKVYGGTNRVITAPGKGCEVIIQMPVGSQ